MSEEAVGNRSKGIAISQGYMHAGANYPEALALLHEHLRPKTYFEIGTSGGATLQLAKCRSIAVDPNFQLSVDVLGAKPSLMLFQTGSDQFFAEQNPEALFGGKINFAFLDGLHFFEFLLRDFINTEKYCVRNSVVAMHDCLPIDHDMTSRPPIPIAENPSPYPEWWTGDVWKIIPVLRKYRPELQVVCLDAPPTGLVLCTNMQPPSSMLADAYFDILAEWRDVSLEKYGVERFLREAEIASTETIRRFSDVASRFWL